MNAQQIKNAHLLDIIFEGKNKSYGAYELRSNYNKRISMAVVLMLAFVSALLTLPELFKKDAPIEKLVFTVHEMNPENYTLPDKKPVIGTKQKHAVKVDSKKFSTIEIVKDNQVHETAPKMSDLEKTNIDIQTIDGERNLTITPPSEPTSTQVIPANENAEKKEPEICFPIETDASFPGGAQAWMKYIQNALMMKVDEFEESDYGTCIVKFEVDERGNVSDVNAITMQGSRLAEIAVNAIRKGPKWSPAQQNGRHVKAYRLQPVTLLNPDN